MIPAQDCWSFYSVPYRFACEKVDSRLTATTIEVFHRGAPIASDTRNDARVGHTTVDAHMTPAHQAVLGWYAPRLLDGATRIGPHACAVVQGLLHQRRHPPQGYRACLGTLRFVKAYGDDRLEVACERDIAPRCRLPRCGCNSYFSRPNQSARVFPGAPSQH